MTAPTPNPCVTAQQLMNQRLQRLAEQAKDARAAIERRLAVYEIHFNTPRR